jgi:hypothetical protein
MELKNCRIGMLIADRMLRRMLSELLWKNGAAVYCADTEEEMAVLVERVGLELVVTKVNSGPEPFSLN